MKIFLKSTLRKLTKFCGYAAAVAFIVGMLLIQPWQGARTPVINDVTQINPIMVDRVVTPKTVAEIQEAVKSARGPVSIGGGRYSMGGQTATEGALQIDMRGFDHILKLDKKAHLVTVEAGITWRKLQAELDKQDLSVQIMQTYSNFTVGGSISVNVHGRYVGAGPLILSVRSLKVVLADGTLVEASPQKNSDIFYGVAGGYGGLGAIVEATLSLDDNVKIMRHAWRVPAEDYSEYFAHHVRNNPDAVFHNGDLYPPNFNAVSAVTWQKTDEPVTVTDRFVQVQQFYPFYNLMYFIASEIPGGLKFRKNYVEPAFYDRKVVEWRNYEASYDVKELEPPTRFFSTYVLNEYFIPVGKFSEFIPKMKAVFDKYHVKVLNVSIRHAKADPGSLLAWARGETFAFVVYYKQGTSDAARKEVGQWTREMSDAILSVGGAWYLPYQPHATISQFLKAYPRAPEFFALKEKLDPAYKFRNKLWDKYYFRTDSERKAKEEAQADATYARREEQTFLTLPEWYIVFSPDEYAQSLKKAPPSAFPYFSSIAQFWRVYHNVIRATWDAYPFNWGYHAMICVIGASYSVELLFKGIYENTVGRLFEWIGGVKAGPTEAMAVEGYQQWVAQDYVDFIRIRPWYEYPFYQRFKEYWTTSDKQGASAVRRFERRIFFSAELLFKSFYGWVIGLGTAAAYDPQAEKIGTIIIENGQYKHADLPRYQALTDAVPKMIAKGVKFSELAGNKRILMTVVAPGAWKYADAPAVMYEWPVLTEPSKKRVAILAPVEKLHEIVPALEKQGVTLDHLFDY